MCRNAVPSPSRIKQTKKKVKTDWKIRFTMRLTKIDVMLYQLVNSS